MGLWTKGSVQVESSGNGMGRAKDAKTGKTTAVQVDGKWWAISEYKGKRK